jgi:6-phosphogluconolactonase/glucosamine-6-phosphate isomerase/deaminase
MKINRLPPERLAFETARKISAILEDYQDNDVLLLLAGGSAFAMYDAISPQFISNTVTMAMTDDRFSQEMDVNNTHLLQATDFYNEAINNDAYFISTEVWQEEKPEELAARFEAGLRKWRAEFPKGKVVAVFGLGPDGHTCGMIPDKSFEKNFQDTEKWVVGYTTENNEYHERITITPAFIKQFVDRAVVYISGEKKREALDKLLASEGNLAETPARILCELKNVELFTDIK